jgi:transcription initiation factor IIE alpha subunit
MRQKTKLQEINEKVTEQKLHLHNVSGSICDHKVRTHDGMVMGFRFVCEICGKDLTKQTNH